MFLKIKSFLLSCIVWVVNGALDEVLMEKPIGFIFNQIKKLTIKIYSNLSNINRHYYLSFRMPLMHRQFFRDTSQNPEYVQTYSNNLNNPFHFA